MCADMRTVAVCVYIYVIVCEGYVLDGVSMETGSGDCWMTNIKRVFGGKKDADDGRDSFAPTLPVRTNLAPFW